MNEQSIIKAPYSEEAEQAVLGCLMQDSEKVFDEITVIGVDLDSFYIPANRDIFQAALDLRAVRRVSDLRTISQKLKDNGKYDEIGGDSYLIKLIDVTPTTAHARHYLEILREKHTRREMIALGQLSQQEAYNEEAPAKELLDGMLSRFFEAAKMRLSVKSNCDAINEKLTEWAMVKKGVFPGLPCFLKTVARWLGTMRYGKLYFIGAAPAGGKSTWMSCQARHWASAGIPVAINSIEMEHSELIGRMLCEMADVSSFALDTGYEKGDVGRGGKTRLERVYEAAEEMVDVETGANRIPLYIDERQMNIDEFCVWARLMVHKYGVKAICVDYIQIIRASNNFKGSQRERLEEISNKFRELAKELHVVMIVLSQLSGEGAQGIRPSPADLFGSKSMQQAAYAVIMLYTESNECYADVQKNRGGHTGRVKVDFRKDRQRFEDDETEVLNDGLGGEEKGTGGSGRDNEGTFGEPEPFIC